jgi:hypothetical protein
MQSRLLVDWFKQLADQLGNKENIPPEVLEEQMFRLTVGVVMLLRRHQVNKRGQCKYCGWTKWTWRLWRRRPQCTVYGALGFAAGQPLDIVRWQLLDDHKKRASPRRSSAPGQAGVSPDNRLDAQWLDLHRIDSTIGDHS